LVDAPASGAGDVKVIGVRVSSWAPNLCNYNISVCSASSTQQAPLKLAKMINNRFFIYFFSYA